MADLGIDDLITGALDTNGIFNELMSAIDDKLKEQYVLNRITGDAYATVYLGALQSAIQQSIAFALGKDQAAAQVDLINQQTEASRVDTILKQINNDKDIELKDRQLVAMDLDDDLKREQIRVSQHDSSLKQVNSDKDIELKNRQLVAMDLDGDLKREQTEASRVDTILKQINNDKDIELKDRQLVTMDLDDDLKREQIRASQHDSSLKQVKSDDELLTTAKQRLVLDEEIIKAQEEIDLLQSQDLEVIAGTTRAGNESTAKVALTDAQRLSQLQETQAKVDDVNKSIEVKAKQIEEINSNIVIKESQNTQDLANKASEKILTDRKSVTEEYTASLTNQKYSNAIIEATVLTNTAAKIADESTLLNQKEITEWANTKLTAKSGTIDGITGSKIALYTQQEAAFKKDAAYKAAKLIADAWSIGHSTDKTACDLPSGAATAAIAEALYDMAGDLYAKSDDDTPSFVFPVP